MSLKQKLLKSFKSQSNLAILFRATSIIMLIQPIGLAISFFTSIFLSRVTGVEGFGVYFFVLSYLQVLSLFAQLGWKTSLLRFVPAYLENQEWGKLKGVLRRSTQMMLTASLGAAIIVSLVVLLLEERMQPELRLSFWVAMLALPLLVLTQTRSALLRAFKRATQDALLIKIIRPTVFVVLVALFFWLGAEQLRPSLVMLLFALAYLLAVLICEGLLRQLRPEALATAKPIFDTKFWLKVSLPIFALDGLAFTMKRIDAIMLGSLVDTTQVAFYGAASRVAELGQFGLIAANLALAPMISGLYHSNKKDELQAALSLAAKLILGLTIVLSLGLIVLGPFVLGLFGAEFKIAYRPLMVLLIGQVVAALSGTVGYIMSLTNYHNQAAILVAVAMLVNVTLNALLIPTFGMMGAAVATTVSALVWNISGLIFVIRVIKLNPTILPSSWLGLNRHSK